MKFGPFYFSTLKIFQKKKKIVGVPGSSCFPEIQRKFQTHHALDSLALAYDRRDCTCGADAFGTATQPEPPLHTAICTACSRATSEQGGTINFEC